MKIINSFPYELTNEDIRFKVESNKKYVLNLKEDTILNTSIFIDGDLSKDVSLEFNVSKYSTLNLVLFTVNIKSYVLNINLKESATLSLTTTDSISDSSNTIKNINILGREAKASVYEFISSKNSENKIGTFNLNHFAKDSTSTGTFVYLSKDTSTISRDVVANAIEGMTNTTSIENIKGVLLGEYSRIDAKPILKIALDDVHVSHGCAIGTIDSNEVYYLMSRGLTKEDALKMICYSLINPIIKAPLNDEFRELIRPLLEEEII